MSKIWDFITGNFGKSTSLFGTLNFTDAMKILRTGALVGAASAVAYLSGALDSVDWGMSEQALVVGLTMLAETIQRALKDNKDV